MEGRCNKKLLNWGRLTFGPNPVIADYTGKLSGDCNQCRKFHADNRRGLPCLRCPKYKLHGRDYGFGFGLLPQNVLLARIYEMSIQHQVGGFGGTIDLVTPQSVAATLDEMAGHFANPWQRQKAFEAVMALNRVAVEGVRKREDLVEKNRPKK